MAVVLESVCDAVEDGLMVEDPMESGVGEDDVILITVVEGACVFDDKGEVWEDFGGVVFGGKADHVEGVIDADDVSSWEEGGDFGGDFSVAAADIEEAFVAAELEFLEEFAGPSLLLGGVLVVVEGVPGSHVGWVYHGGWGFPFVVRPGGWGVGRFGVWTRGLVAGSIGG